MYYCQYSHEIEYRYMISKLSDQSQIYLYILSATIAVYYLYIRITPVITK